MRASDATTRTAGATVKATASSGVTPNSKSCMRRREHAGAKHAERNAGKRDRQPFAHHETHEIDAPCTERCTNRELTYALRHAVGQRAVQSDRGQHHRHAGEAGHHGGREPRRIERCGQGRRQWLDPIDHGLAFDLAHEGTDVLRERRRIAGRSDHEVHPSLDALAMRSVDEVQLGLRLPIVAVLEHVANDADDFRSDALRPAPRAVEA